MASFTQETIDKAIKYTDVKKLLPSNIKDWESYLAGLRPFIGATASIYTFALSDQTIPRKSDSLLYKNIAYRSDAIKRFPNTTNTDIITRKISDPIQARTRFTPKEFQHLYLTRGIMGFYMLGHCIVGIKIKSVFGHKMCILWPADNNDTSSIYNTILPIYTAINNLHTKSKSDSKKSATDLIATYISLL